LSSTLNILVITVCYSNLNRIIHPVTTMQAFEDYIGYYDWEGSPCQILRDAEDPTAICARIYIQGEGLRPISVFDVLDGHAITETEFKRMVMRLIGGQ